MGWALAIFTRYEKNFQARLENRDLVREALKCLFTTQTSIGNWRYYRPLFHYPESGNAYCYFFESFSILLKNALEDTKDGRFLRRALQPYLEELVLLCRFAESTRIPLNASNIEVGWSSEHRVNYSDAESWATASVFSSAQAIRRLIGIWTREKALAGLNTGPVLESREHSLLTLKDRGDTWISKSDQFGVRGMADRLCTLFVNPVLKTAAPDKLEPDSQPINKRQARSAILFGPPGTSKTTLARCLAGAIGWDYVELHASHFVADGLPNVQRTADRIFSRLMELDHAVVLFDEIDELVRERDLEPDAFGRFLTTSMLPKIAELWEQRKIVYFIATNHIGYFDQAITRSQRFDALLLVSPPSFQKKVRQLKVLLKDEYQLAVPVKFSVKEEEVGSVFEALCEDDQAENETASEYQERVKNEFLEPSHTLAKFIMLRWDHLNELALHLADSCRDQKECDISKDRLEEALSALVDPTLQRKSTYFNYHNDFAYSRRDFDKFNVWKAIGITEKCPPLVLYENGQFWVVSPVERPDRLKISGYRLTSQDVGSLTYEREK